MASMPGLTPHKSNHERPYEDTQRISVNEHVPSKKKKISLLHQAVNAEKNLLRQIHGENNFLENRSGASPPNEDEIASLLDSFRKAKNGAPQINSNTSQSMSPLLLCLLFSKSLNSTNIEEAEKKLAHFDHKILIDSLVSTGFQYPRLERVDPEKKTLCLGNLAARQIQWMGFSMTHHCCSCDCAMKLGKDTIFILFQCGCCLVLNEMRIAKCAFIMLLEGLSLLGGHKILQATQDCLLSREQCKTLLTSRKEQRPSHTRRVTLNYAAQETCTLQCSCSLQPTRAENRNSCFLFHLAQCTVFTCRRTAAINRDHAFVYGISNRESAFYVGFTGPRVNNEKNGPRSRPANLLNRWREHKNMYFQLKSKKEKLTCRYLPPPASARRICRLRSLGVLPGDFTSKTLKGITNPLYHTDPSQWRFAPLWYGTVDDCEKLEKMHIHAIKNCGAFDILDDTVLFRARPLGEPACANPFIPTYPCDDPETLVGNDPPLSNPVLQKLSTDIAAWNINALPPY